MVFLYALPPAQLAAQPELADAAMSALFSRHAGTGVSLFIGLISFGAASVVVLGGGLAGLCSAYELKQRGYTILAILEGDLAARGLHYSVAAVSHNAS